MNVKSVLQTVNPRTLSTNTQKAAYKLLIANGDWVSRKALERYIPNFSARARDLRKSEFGNINVQCASAAELKKNGGAYTFFYRINPNTVTTKQVSAVFGI
jgi:hypothetical protein